MWTRGGEGPGIFDLKLVLTRIPDHNPPTHKDGIFTETAITVDFRYLQWIFTEDLIFR